MYTVAALKSFIAQKLDIQVNKFIIYTTCEKNELILPNINNYEIISDYKSKINVCEQISIFYEVIEGELPEKCLIGNDECV